MRERKNFRGWEEITDLNIIVNLAIMRHAACKKEVQIKLLIGITESKINCLRIKGWTNSHETTYEPELLQMHGF